MALYRCGRRVSATVGARGREHSVTQLGNGGKDGMKPLTFRFRAVQSAAILGGISLLVAACGNSTSTTSGLASSQVLKFPVYQSPGTWDPGETFAEVDSEIMQNVFDNLWRFD